MKKTIIFALCLVCGFSLRGQGVYNLTVTTTNGLGAPSGSLSALFDSSLFTTNMLTQFQAIYDGPADIWVTNQGMIFNYSHVRMRIGAPTYGLFFFFSDIPTDPQVNVYFNWTNYPFSDVTADTAMSTLANPSYPPGIGNVLFFGTDMEGISSFSVTGVPEPPGVFLAAAGLLAAIFWRRRPAGKFYPSRRASVSRHAPSVERKPCMTATAI